MKIAIISDIHDNLVNLNKVLSLVDGLGVDKILCCGDVTNEETLAVLAHGFGKEIFLVKGNAEIYNEKELKKYDNIIDGGRFDIFNIGAKKIGACHEPFMIGKVFEKDSPDIIFYGHTHKPWIKEKKGIKIVNPGTLGGVFYRASFAVWDIDSDKLELKILDTI